MRLVIGYHLVWTAYGWWLPNDPRGSMSHRVQSDLLAESGDLHYGRKRFQPARAELKRLFSSARTRLDHEAREFDADEVAVIAESFATVIERKKLTCYACAITFTC